MVKISPARITIHRLLAVLGVTITGYLLLLILKIAITGRREGFAESSTDERPPVFYFTYNSEPGCTHCSKFEPVWDAFVKDSASLFKEALIIPQKVAPKLSHKTSSHDYPDVALVNTNHPTNPTRFDGPYTTQGLKRFMQEFEKTHPERVARVKKYRMEHPAQQP